VYTVDFRHPETDCHDMKELGHKRSDVIHLRDNGILDPLKLTCAQEEEDIPGGCKVNGCKVFENNGRDSKVLSKFEE
jgi:hypothetical protein